MVLGIIAAVQISRGHANLGIDFAGGTGVQLKFDKAVRIDEARKALESQGLTNVDIQEFVNDNKLLVRVKAGTTIEEKVADRIVAVFRKEFPENAFVVESTTEIGPTIGKKLQQDALIAVLVSFVGIIIYIAARFEFRFGVAARPRHVSRCFGGIGCFLYFGQGNYPAGHYSTSYPCRVFPDRHRGCLRQDSRKS